MVSDPTIWGATAPVVSDKFWMCFVEGSGGCKQVHLKHSDAVKEAERLARMPCNRGKRVFVLVSVGRCGVEDLPVTWHPIN